MQSRLDLSPEVLFAVFAGLFDPLPMQTYQTDDSAGSNQNTTVGAAGTSAAAGSTDRRCPRVSLRRSAAGETAACPAAATPERHASKLAFTTAFADSMTLHLVYSVMLYAYTPCVRNALPMRFEEVMTKRSRLAQVMWSRCSQPCIRRGCSGRSVTVLWLSLQLKSWSQIPDVKTCKPSSGYAFILPAI